MCFQLPLLKAGQTIKNINLKKYVFKKLHLVYLLKTKEKQMCLRSTHGITNGIREATREIIIRGLARSPPIKKIFLQTNSIRISTRKFSTIVHRPHTLDVKIICDSD